MKSTFLFILLFLAAVSCSTEKQKAITADFDTVQDSTSILFSVTRLSGPEAVRFDESQNVFFISNFNGGGNDQDSNGFITKVDAEGNTVDLKFMTGNGKLSPSCSKRNVY